MPTYEYVCEACGHELELFQSISEAPKKTCPACKKRKLKRKIGGGAGFLFKGSGFYLTDYRSDSYKKGADADKPADSSAKTEPEKKSAPATPAAHSESPPKKKKKAQ